MATQAAPAPIPIAQLLYNADSRQLGGKIGRQAFSSLRNQEVGGEARKPRHGKAVCAATWLPRARSKIGTAKLFGAEARYRRASIPVSTCRAIRNTTSASGSIETQAPGHASGRLLRRHRLPITEMMTSSFMAAGTSAATCIVPLVPAQRMLLTHAIRNFGGLVQLTVKGVGYMLPAERFDGLNA